MSPDDVLVVLFVVSRPSTRIGGSDVGVEVGGDTGLSRSSVKSISSLGRAFFISLKLLMLAMGIT
jgi:hypothetical protein